MEINRRIAMASDIPLSCSLIEKSPYNSGISSRANQDISFTLPSPSVADSVPCIDTSIFTTLPTATFNELLQQYEDPAVSIPETFSQTPLKDNLTILPLVGGAEASTTAHHAENAETLPDWPLCSCSPTNIGDEIPEEQVFIRNGQMYRLPEAGVISVGNMSLNSFYRSNHWYVSLALLYHIIGPEAKQIYQKAMINSPDLEFMTGGDNELELLKQKTGLSMLSTDATLKDLISIQCLQAISRKICETLEIPVIRIIAYGDIYRKVLGNNVRCSNCGFIIRKEPADEKYELVLTQASNGIPLTVGMVSISNVKFCGFQMKDKTYINLAEVVWFKMFKWPAVHRKLHALGISPVHAPEGVEEKFDSGSSMLAKGMWLDLVDLRCLCCMGNGKCQIKGHSEEVWQAFKMGEYTYEPHISLIAEGSSKPKLVFTVPLSDSQTKMMSPTSSLMCVNSDEIHVDANAAGANIAGLFEKSSPNKVISNGSEEHVSSTTEDFMPLPPQLNVDEDSLEQATEPVCLFEGAETNSNPESRVPPTEVTVSEVRQTPIRDSVDVIHFQIEEPSGEVVEVKIAELEENEELASEITQQTELAVDNTNHQSGKMSEGVIEMSDTGSNVQTEEQTAGTKNGCIDSGTSTDERCEDDYQEYFIGRPRGRPTKLQDAYVFKSPVETSTKCGCRFLFPGDCIVPDLEELRRQIQCKKVIIGQKSLSQEILTNESIKGRKGSQKFTSARISYSGKLKDTAQTCPIEKTEGESKKNILKDENKMKDMITEKTQMKSKMDINHKPDLDVCHSSNTRQLNTQNDKVIVEYVKNRVNEQNFTAHEKEVERTEVCQSSEVQTSHQCKSSESPEKSAFNKTELLVHAIEHADSETEAKKKKICCETEDINMSNTTESPNPVAGLVSRSPLCFSPEKDIHAQTGGTPKTPPSRRVERLTKLASSESFNRPDAALLTLATLAADNESDVEVDQTDIVNENKDRSHDVQYQTDMNFKNIDSSAVEKCQVETNEKTDDKINDKNNTEQHNKMDLMAVPQTAEGNRPSESKLNSEDGMLSETLLMKDIIETVLSNLKKYTVFTFDQESDLLKVQKFEEGAKCEFPALFEPRFEELQSRFVLELSLYMTNKYRNFIQKKSRKGICSEKSMKPAGPKSVADMIDAANHPSHLSVEQQPETERNLESSESVDMTVAARGNIIESCEQKTGKCSAGISKLETDRKLVTSNNNNSNREQADRSNIYNSTEISSSKVAQAINAGLKPKHGRPGKKDQAKQSSVMCSDSTIMKLSRKNDQQSNVENISQETVEEVTSLTLGNGENVESQDDSSDMNTSAKVGSYERLLTGNTKSCSKLGKHKKFTKQSEYLPPKLPEESTKKESLASSKLSGKKTGRKKKIKIDGGGRTEISEDVQGQTSESETASAAFLNPILTEAEQNKDAVQLDTPFEVKEKLKIDLVGAFSSPSAACVTNLRVKTDKTSAKKASSKKLEMKDTTVSDENNSVRSVDSGLEKIVIKRDKSGKHVLQTVDKPESKELCKEKNIRQMDDSVIRTSYSDRDARKSSEKHTHSHNKETFDTKKIKDGKINFPKKEISDKKSKPLKKMLIKLKFAKKSKAESESESKKIIDNHYSVDSRVEDLVPERIVKISDDVEDSMKKGGEYTCLPSGTKREKSAENKTCKLDLCESVNKGVDIQIKSVEKLLANPVVYVRKLSWPTGKTAQKGETDRIFESESQSRSLKTSQSKKDINLKTGSDSASKNPSKSPKKTVSEKDLNTKVNYVPVRKSSKSPSKSPLKKETNKKTNSDNVDGEIFVSGSPRRNSSIEEKKNISSINPFSKEFSESGKTQSGRVSNLISGNEISLRLSPNQSPSKKSVKTSTSKSPERKSTVSPKKSLLKGETIIATASEISNDITLGSSLPNSKYSLNSEDGQTEDNNKISNQEEILEKQKKRKLSISGSDIAKNTKMRKLDHVDKAEK